MQFLQRIAIGVVTATAILVSGAAVQAHIYSGNALAFPNTMHNYTGSWPVTVTGSQFSDGTGCLTLSGTDGGGSAKLVFGGQTYSYGSFLVINGILMATITEPLYGQNGALTFVASAEHARPGKGLYENIEGGSNFDKGALSFGAKNGC